MSSAVVPLRKLIAALGGREGSDEELLSLYLATGDEAAFGTLVRRYGALVLDVARCVLRNDADAEDVFQATFLTLATKAGSVRNASALPAWLHGVAYRIALKAQQSAARRRKHEQSGQGSASATTPDLAWADVQQTIHQELLSLPERYRAPLLLCYLNGLTQDEAARSLSLSKAGLKKRLDRGRSLLRRRLVQRGLGPAAVLAAAAWPAAASAVPHTLLHATVLAGMKGGVSAVPPRVVALVEGGRRVALKWLIATAAVVAGVGMTLCLMRGEPQPSNPQEPPRPEVAAEQPGDPLPAHAVARLGTQRFRSDTWVSQVAVVPGGKQLLGVGFHGIIQWDATTGKEVRRYEGPVWRKTKDGATSVRVEVFAVSPDGKTLAVGTADSSRLDCPILLFDLASGEKRSELPGHPSDGYSANRALAFVTPELLVSVGANGPARVWDVPARREARRLETSEKYALWSLAASPDRKQVFGAGRHEEKNAWVVWDVETGKVLHREVGLPGGFVKAAVSPDGTRLAVTLGVGEVQQEGCYNEVRLYSTAGWKEQRQWRTHEGRYPQRNSVAFAPDGRTLATGGADHKVRRWDAETGKEIGSAIEPYRYANNVAYLDADTLLTFDAQNALKLWDARSGKPKFESAGAEAHLTALTCSPDGRHLAIGGGGGDATVRVWDTITRKQVAHLRGDMSDITSLHFSPDGRRIVSADSGGKARLWDWSSGRELRALGEHKPWLHAVAFGPDGRHLATGDDAGVVRVWDAETGKVVHTLAGHTAQIAALEFGHDGRSVMSASWDHSIRCWDLTLGKTVWVARATHDAAGNQTNEGHGSVVSSLALSPGGRWLYSGSYDHTIRVWDADTGRPCRTLKGEGKGFGSVNSIALSPDGTLLAAALGDDGQDKSVHVWDVLTGEKIRTLPGHRGRVTKVAVSPNGRQLVSASVDTTALVWDLAALRPERKAVNAKAVASLWDDLGSAEPTPVYAAVCRAAAAGDVTVAALRERLKPVAAADEKKFAEWIGKLDSAEFEDREQATQTLAALGAGAEPLLRRLAETTKSAEVRKRAERLLTSLATDNLRVGRALEVLQMIGSSDAKHLLRELAGGVPSAWLTDEASAVLKRSARP